MNAWSLNTRFYFTIENRWFLDENYQFETTDLEAKSFCSLNTRFFLTIENRLLPDEKFQFETADVKTITF